MKPKGILVIAIVLGLVTSFLVYGYVSALSDRPQRQEARVAVVVAQADLRPRSVISPGMVRIAEVPLSAVHPDAIISVAEAEGRIVKETVVAGEQVLRTRLYGLTEQPGLTFAIPPGKRAITVAVNEVIGVAGFVQPGDRVDVLATFDRTLAGVDMTRTVLQSVEVLAIAQQTEIQNDRPQVTTTVTLAVSLDEAERLTLAEETGVLRLALKPALFGDEEPVRGVTSNEVLGLAPPPAPEAPTQTVSRFDGPQESGTSREIEVEVIRGTRVDTVTLP